MHYTAYTIYSKQQTDTSYTVCTLFDMIYTYKPNTVNTLYSAFDLLTDDFSTAV